MKSKSKSNGDSSIALNRKARHEYSIEETFETGLVLYGWEVKSIRAGRINLAEGYILLKGNEAWLLGVHISPLESASTHIVANPTRTRKLLLHRKEINTLIGKVEQKGYTAIPLKMYWKKAHIKLQIALAKGKKLHDKRAATKERDWQREKARIMKR